MEPRDLKTLFLLEAIDREECQSQRELSRKLNISLGLVNAFIKKLSVRGFFNIINLPKSRVKYTLTQKGISEKSKLSIHYVSYLVNVYKETKQRLQLSFDRLCEDGIYKIVLYGANELSEIACTLQHKPSLKVVSIIDNKKNGEKMNGVKVCKEEDLHKLSFDAVIIIDTENPNMAREKLIGLSVPAHKIINLF